jgi:hypothetical protein
MQQHVLSVQVHAATQDKMQHSGTCPMQALIMTCGWGAKAMSNSGCSPTLAAVMLTQQECRAEPEGAAPMTVSQLHTPIYHYHSSKSRGFSAYSGADMDAGPGMLADMDAGQVGAGSMGNNT